MLSPRNSHNVGPLVDKMVEKSRQIALTWLSTFGIMALAAEKRRQKKTRPVRVAA